VQCAIIRQIMCTYVRCHNRMRTRWMLIVITWWEFPKVGSALPALENTTRLEIWRDELKWVLNIDRLTMKYMKMPQNSHSTEQQLEQPRSTLLSFFISPKQTAQHNYVTHYGHAYSLCKWYNFLHSSTDSNSNHPKQCSIQLSLPSPRGW